MIFARSRKVGEGWLRSGCQLGLRSALALIALALLALGSVASSAYAQTSPSEGYAVHPAFERGFSAETAYQLQADANINLFNGNLNVTLPIGPRLVAEGNLTYGFTLAFNSGLWRFDTITQFCDASDTGTLKNEALPASNFNAGLGWTLTGGELYAPRDFPYVDSDQWQLLSGDGSLHAFSDRLHLNDTEPFDDGVFYTRDGSYLRLRTLDSAAPPTDIEVDHPNGIVHAYQRNATDDGYWLVRVEDPFGNRITVTHTANKQIWEDLHGRKMEIVFQNSTFGRRIDKVKVPKFGDALGAPTATWDFHYATAVSIPRPPGDTTCAYDGTVPTNLTVDQLTGITRPDGTGYTFTYSPVAATIGKLATLDLPTGGGYEWTYRNYRFPTFNEPEPFRAQLESVWGVSTRREKDADGSALGEWSYLQKLALDYTDAQGEPEFSVTRIESPEDSAVSHHYFDVQPRWSYGLAFAPTLGDPEDSSSRRGLSTLTLRPQDSPVTNDSVFPSLPGQALAASYVAYEGDAVPVVDPQKNNHRVVSSRRYRLDSNSGNACADPVPLATSSPQAEWVQTDHSNFDGLGNFRQTVTTGSRALTPQITRFSEYDRTSQTYAVDLTNPDVPVNTTPYNLPTANTPWVLGIMSSSEVRQGNQTQRSEYCVDGATGVPYRTRTLALFSGARDSSDIVQTVTLDPGGTGRVVEELTYGGDGAGLSTSGALCSLALPEPSYKVEYDYTAGLRTATRWVDPTHANGPRVTVEDVDLDAATGLVSVARVSEGSGGALTATYGYDALGRMTSIQPTHDASFDYLYTPATGASGPRLTLRRSEGGQVLTESEVRFDGLGRPFETFTTLPLGADRQRVATTYDELGRATATTVAHLEGTANPSVSVSEFDLLGRACRQTAPDGRVSSTRHERSVVQSRHSVPTPTGTTSTNRFTTHDDLGRLRVVNELSGPGGVGVNTRYEYDVTGSLVDVRMTDGQTEALGQQRTFTYDGRGFLLSECLPEKGSTGVGNLGCMTYEGYDALGKARVARDADAAYDLEMRYDAVGRLVQVRKANCTGSDCRLQEYVYARDNVSGADKNWSIDRLVRAQQHNYVPDPRDAAQTLRVTVAETYAYRGPEGRVSERSTLVTGLRDDGSGALASSEGSYRFDLSVGYDALGQVGEVHYPSCQQRWCANFFPRTELEHSYDEGVLTAVAPLGGASTPYATFAFHPNGMLERVSHRNGVDDIYDADPTGLGRISRIRLGTTFDRAFTFQQGYLTAVGPDQYRYDPVGRLASATVASQGQSTQLTYGYDAAGNLTSRTRDGAPTLHTVDLASNRIVDPGFVYDAAGHLNAFDGITLTRDPLGRVIRSQGAGADRVFVYTTSGERIATYQVGSASQPPEASFTLRGLDDKVLRRFTLTEATDGSEDWDLSEDLVYRGGLLLTRLRPTSTIASQREVHYHLDHLGSPRLLTDTSGSVLFRRDFLPFGEQLHPATTDDGAFRFTGHERDTDGSLAANLDLDYMHARYYSSRVGRFLSLDPAAADPAVPQSWNRYTYVLNTPTTLIDEYGLIAQCTSDREDNPSCVDDEAVEVIARDPWHDWNLNEKLNYLTWVNGGTSFGCTDFACQVMNGVAEARPGVEALEAGTVFFVEVAMGEAAFSHFGGMLFRAINARRAAQAEETVDLFRAVSPNEFHDIFRIGGFRSAPGGGMFAGKQFGLNLDEVVTFADQFPDAAAVVRTRVPKDTFNALEYSNRIDPFIFRHGVVTAQPGRQLDLLNSTLQSIEHVF